MSDTKFTSQRPLAWAIPVLLYHSVAETEELGLRGYNATPDQFSRHLDLIAESGREAVGLRQLVASIAGRETGHVPQIAVTFDDGFADNLAACERLAERNIDATVFVTSSYVDTPGMLTTTLLRELDQLPGIEIGAHSVSHPHLDELSAAEARDEIVGSKRELEQMLGHEVDTFAYPHGAFDRQVRAIVERAGFGAAAAVKNAISHYEDDPFAIARWTVTSGVSDGDVATVVAGRGAPKAWRNERTRTRLARVVRKSRRRLAGAGGKPKAIG